MADSHAAALVPAQRYAEPLVELATDSFLQAIRDVRTRPAPTRRRGKDHTSDFTKSRRRLTRYYTSVHYSPVLFAAFAVCRKHPIAATAVCVPETPEVSRCKRSDSLDY